MKIPHDKFCVLPWISLEASPVGTVRPCCLAQREVCDDQGGKFTLGETALDQIQNSHYMQRLRQNFLDGVQPADCSRCWNEEDAGRTSKRQHTLDRLKHLVDDSEWTTQAKPLMFLDLKLGNICNLKCRICGSWSSSSYAVEEIAHDSSIDRKNSFHYIMLKMGRWPRENKTFWNDLEHNMAKLRYLEFTGGEPFMIQEHFDLLNKLVSAGHAPNIEIHYNTNGTLFPSDAEQIWKHFNHVEIAFSIDDVGARFEYQRSGAVWEDVNCNLKLFQDMRDRNHNMTLQVCTTVNAFNILYLADVAAWIDQQSFDFVYWNMLHDAPYFCIANLPSRVKDLAESRLRSAAFGPRHHDEINNIIEFMRKGTDSDGIDLVRNIKHIDLRRDQNLAVVAPELAEALHYV